MKRVLLLILLLAALVFGQSGISGSGVRVSGAVSTNDCVKFVNKQTVASAGAACGTSSTAGTVTSVATASPITGGTFTDTGTIACATCTTSAAALTSGKVLTGSGSQAMAASSTDLTALAPLASPTFIGTVTLPLLATTTNCANGSSPATCSAAAAGAVAVPTGTNPTLVINTTAVTASSIINVQIDESLTISGVTCNTTLSTLVQPVITARTAGTSFTIQIGAVIAANPACVSYLIVN